MFDIQPNRAPEPRRSQPLAPRTPFSTGKVRAQMLPITLDQALVEAERAGFRQTARSRPDVTYMQRSWNSAAKIRAVAGGVTVRPAWTRAQMLVVAAVLALLATGLCGLPGAAIFAG